MQWEQGGAITRMVSYPNVVFVGFVNVPCVAESASGRWALSLSNPLVVMLDTAMHETGTVEGSALAWRPQR